MFLVRRFRFSAFFRTLFWYFSSIIELWCRAEDLILPFFTDCLSTETRFSFTLKTILSDLCFRGTSQEFLTVDSEQLQRFLSHFFRTSNHSWVDIAGVLWYESCDEVSVNKSWHITKLFRFDRIAVDRFCKLCRYSSEVRSRCGFRQTPGSSV